MPLLAGAALGAKLGSWMWRSDGAVPPARFMSWYGRFRFDNRQSLGILRLSFEDCNSPGWCYMKSSREDDFFDIPLRVHGIGSQH